MGCEARRSAQPKTYLFSAGCLNHTCTSLTAHCLAQVLVITTGKGVSLPGVDFYAGVDPPKEFEGAKVVGASSFGCPAYWQVNPSPRPAPGADPRVVHHERVAPLRQASKDCALMMLVPPLVPQVPLSFALEPRIFAEVKKFNADLIHCTSPGAMCFASWLYSKARFSSSSIVSSPRLRV